MKILFFILLLISSSSFAQNQDLREWIDQQYQISIQKLFANLSPNGTLPGTVVASPQKENPDYWYHWVRDAALVVDVVLSLENTENINSKEFLFDFVEVTRINQNRSGFDGLGEPKYYVNGDPYDGPWGRPQNDGPALRAIVLIKLANKLLDKGQFRWVQENLYRAELPANTVIKKDLEYVLHKWRDASFDLWEEIKGQNFYTRMVQRLALYEGAELAKRMNDPQAAIEYRNQAKSIEASLVNHRTTGKAYLFENLYWEEGLNYKHSGLDTSSLLAFLHTDDSFFSLSITDSLLLATIRELEKAFYNEYEINKVQYNGDQKLGVAFGRYPEDLYYNGNPWFLTTLAVAEHHLRLAKLLKSKSVIQIDDLNRDFYSDLLGIPYNLATTDKLAEKSMEYTKVLDRLEEKAFEYFARVRFHAGQDGRLWEQFDRNTGFMLSAYDLTWSYAAFITAYQALVNYERAQ